MMDCEEDFRPHYYGEWQNSASAGGSWQVMNELVRSHLPELSLTTKNAGLMQHSGTCIINQPSLAV
jgi:hypothetical protein